MNATVMVAEISMSFLPSTSRWQQQLAVICPFELNKQMAGKCPEGLPRRLSGKDSPANAGDRGSAPGFDRSPGIGNGYLLQYCCLKNSMDRGAWWAIVHGIPKS